MCPTQPSATASASVATHTAIGYRRGRTVHSAQPASATAPAKNAPLRTLAALADSSTSATYGYARSTGQPGSSGRAAARRRRLQKKIERSTAPAVL